MPQISIDDGTATIGSSGFLPAIEKQNSFVLTDNLTWIHGRHSAKFGTEIRNEQFTLFEPAAPRGTLHFASDFTDNPAAPTTGGEAFATFLLGVTDGGSITNTHNVDYHRQIYSFYGQDDFRMTQRLTLNLGLRYELFTTIKAAGNEQATFDFADDSLVVPRGQTTQLTPFFAANIPVVRNGSAGLISPDLNNFAPRVGLAYQITNRLMLRTGYGIFYGGQENGPYSNPSPGFNPPFYVTKISAQPCFLSAANPSGPGLLDFRALSACTKGSHPIPSPILIPHFVLGEPRVRTPYTQQWHFGFQYQLPSQTVLELSYARFPRLPISTIFTMETRPSPTRHSAPLFPTLGPKIALPRPAALQNVRRLCFPAELQRSFRYRD